MLQLTTADERRLPIGIICTDMDRTLTDRRLRIVPSAMLALDRARRHGVRIVLATGRTTRELGRRGDFFRHFDAIVAEGGAVWGTPKELNPLSPHAHVVDRFETWLEKNGVDHRRGDYAISVARGDRRRLRGYRSLDRFHLAPNRDRIDITLKGVDKGSALRRVRRELLSDANGGMLAFADGENDIPLFATSDYRVAVANAVPELAKHADEVLKEYGGKGLARFVSRRLLPRGDPR